MQKMSHFLSFRNFLGKKCIISLLSTKNRYIYPLKTPFFTGQRDLSKFSCWGINELGQNIQHWGSIISCKGYCCSSSNWWFFLRKKFNLTFLILHMYCFVPFQDHQYNSIDELEVDILLVFKNAHAFNEPKSQISKVCIDLLTGFQCIIVIIYIL